MVELVSKTISMRLVEVDDAQFICQIRNDEGLNKYISQSTNDVEQQKMWILNYKEREYNNKEYYFIIFNKENSIPIGTVRLYDFREDKNSFCWGSWLLSENKTPFSAIESALLVYSFGFNHLGFVQSHFDVMKDNIKVQSFHEKMGAIKYDEDEYNFYYILKKEQYENILSKYQRFL